ncbi:GSCFA domain-containing protein [Halomonas sp. KRD171]|uniref:GSCFA domain-containing protein n=1 Tax=Halomonas sp. KRD171 TaxID=2729726 RepID=UPI0019D303AE|nr:GSCFA domain-containing protein [Halomonas sp. KRD171]
MKSDRFLVFGSCLSGHVAVHLRQRGYNFLGALRHVRSDVLVDALNGEQGMSIDERDINYLVSNMKERGKKHSSRIKDQLRQNSKESLSLFIQKLKQADFVVFDNQYDLERVRSIIHVNENAHSISNLNTSNLNVPSKKIGVLPEKDLGCYNELFSLFKNINPNVKLIFIQYPIVSGEELQKTGRQKRIIRSRLTSELRSEWKFLSTPLYRVGVDYVSDKNINHFLPVVYNELASVVEAILVGGKNVNHSKITDLEGFEKAQDSPYASLPDRQYWKPAVAEPYPLAITDLYRKKFDIGIEDGVATCGSCFAQHIGKRLDRKGYNYLDVEPVPADLAKEKAKALGYGIYSARYGNVYTSRQLVQLFDRAFGALSFDEAWQDKAGRYVDPFRPNLCGEGYTSAAEVLEEQQKHLQNVRHMFETLDVFVFTMGVTETWINRQTGAVYPICPGVTAGTFDPNTYEFVNLDYATILDEMETFLSRLREVNPKAKVLLTVSPVPLTATAEERHVLLSTMASKSILRAVADQLYRRHAHVDYFPSYDIIMSPPFKSMFFKNNLRSIHEEGVDYVMSHFFAEHQLEGQPVPRDLTATGQETADEAKEEEDDEAFCDEAFLELERKTNHE